MATLLVTRESENQKAQFVALTHKNNAGEQVIAGADAPVIVVDVNHQRNHDGRAFFAYKLAPDSAPLAANASIDIVLASPAGVFPHLTLDGLCLGDAELYVYEGTATTGGTSFTPINRNRNYAVSNPSQVAMVINPTVTSLGTQLDAQIIPGGVGKSRNIRCTASCSHSFLILCCHYCTIIPAPRVVELMPSSESMRS